MSVVRCLLRGCWMIDVSWPPVDFDFSAIPEADPVPVPAFSGVGRGRITILRCAGGTATKTFTHRGSTDYSVGRFFDHETRAVNGIGDIYQVLTGIELDRSAFVVRGHVLPGALRRIVRRSKGETATLASPEEGGYWVCLDLDGVETEMAGTPVEIITKWINKIPQLRGIDVVYQLSASYGIKPGLRAHMWYWLEEPRTDTQLVEWVAGLPFKVDLSLLHPVQPHYTAAPVFNGVTDPLAGMTRYGLIHGETPALFVPSGDIEAELRHWEDKIITLGETGDPRHPLVNRAAFALGGWVAGGMLDETEVTSRLITACAQSGAFDSDRLETIKGEITRAVNDGAKSPRQVSAWKTGLRVTDKGVIMATPANMLHIFRFHPAIKDCFAFNVREQSIEIIKRTPWDREGSPLPRACKDHDDVEAAAWLNQIGMITAGIAQISGIINAVAQHNTTDAVTAYLDRLIWDGVPRVAKWLSHAAGVSDTHYHSEISRKFLISMVARAYDPGCKADHMLILCGAQGTLKSSMLAALAGGVAGGFADAVGDITNPKDFVPNLMGPWLLEIPELSAFSRKEVENIKQFLTAQRDRHRLAYGRRAVDIPRRCIFAGTTNDKDPLQDNTGNRRFWPVDVVRIDLRWVIDNRDQLFAEAVTMFRAGEPWYLTGPALTEAQKMQADHTAADPWEEKILYYINGYRAGEWIDFSSIESRFKTEITAGEILENVVDKPLSTQHTGDCRRVGNLMARMGWTRHRGRRNGSVVWLWKRPEGE
jgi:predicted P-loop ATPase